MCLQSTITKVCDKGELLVMLNRKNKYLKREGLYNDIVYADAK